MAVKIKFDLINNPEPPTLVLANRNGNKLGQLDVNPESIELIDKFNGASEISFTVNKYIDDEITNLWDKLVDFKLIYCPEWKRWFEAKVELDEATESVKTVFCTQLGQAELSQIMLYDIEINTEADIERDDYKIGILYDPDDSKASILNRLLEKAPHYSIKHVDNTIANIQRSFSFDNTSIHDAFQDIAEEIGCLFVYNSDSDENGMPQRTISVYDLQQNCLNDDCGYRGEFTDKCPKCDSKDIVCEDCGYTGKLAHKCPECGSENIKYNIKYGYGDDTLIFVTSDELASQGIQLVTDTDSVKNCFKLEAGDDLMTATIRNRNPNGTDYIWYFSDATKEDMPVELVEKIEDYDEQYRYYYNENESNLDINLLNSYNALVDKYKVYNEELEEIKNPITGFAALMEAYYNTIDLGWYLRSGMMPSVTIRETNAEEQALRLSTELPVLIAVANLNTVTKATADSSILSMARAIVASSYKVSINSSSLSEGTTRSWSGSFTITNYSDEKDECDTDTINRSIIDWDEEFIKQKIDKILYKENVEDVSIVGLFKEEFNYAEHLDEKGNWVGCNGTTGFCAELKKYALVPLTGFRDACQACLDVLIEQGVGSTDSTGTAALYDSNGNYVQDSNGNYLKNENMYSLYTNLYLPYFYKLKAIEAEMKIREDELNIILGVYDANDKLTQDGLQTNIEKIKIDIQDNLNFQNYLGNDLWLQFSAYRREDKYSNSNYISDGLNNAELFERALQFYEVAENEIFKSSELQHSITATLNNLLAIPKFKPLVESFEVGNWIRVLVNDKLFKLRLIEYEISYSDFNNITVKFSDVAKIKNGYSDLEDILSDASSMASSYDGIKRQANLGNEARDMVRQWMNEGLDASLVQIQNNTNEDIVIDNNGLIGRSYSDIIGEYSPEQIRLTHNVIAFTDNNWESVKQAIGKHKYKDFDGNGFVDTVGYGVSADFVTAGIVSGSKIIGGTIYSDNYAVATNDNAAQGSYIDLRTGDFSLGGGALQFDRDTNELKINSPSIPDEGYIEGIVKNTIVGPDGITTPEIKANNLWINAANVEGTLTAAEIDAGRVKAGELKGHTIIGGSLSIEDEKGNTYAKISESGILTCSGADIRGTINGSDIIGGSFKDIDGNTSITMSSYENEIEKFYGFQFNILLKDLYDSKITASEDGFILAQGQLYWVRRCFGNNILQYNYENHLMCPMGNWDFSWATVTGLPEQTVTAVFA